MTDISVNVEQALARPNLAKILWLNYYKCSNSLNISDYDIGRIESAWENLIPQWQNSTVTDENVYDFEFTMEEWNNAVEEGEEQGRDLTGYKATNGQKAGDITRCAVDGTVAAVTGVRAAATGTKNVVNFGTKLLGGGGSAATTGAKTVKSGGEVILDGGKNILGSEMETIGGETLEIGTNVGTKGGGEAAKKTVTDLFLLIACGLDMASAAWYLIDKPNEEASNAVNELAKDMGNQQSATMGAQNNLVTMDEELLAAAEEAYTFNDDANIYMAEQKTMYDFYAGTYEYLTAAKTAGHQFSKDELKLYDESIQYMTAVNEDIGITQEDTTTTVTEINEDMLTYQAGFDEVAQTAGNVQGVTDYAASFDESTQTMCTVEKYSQMVSGAAAGVDAIQAAAEAASSGITIGGAILYGAAAVGAAAAAVMDTKASAEQGQMAEQAGMEIELRAQTQDMNVATQELYDMGIDNYEADVESVEELELEVPDDVEVPVESGMPAEEVPNDRNNGGHGVGGGSDSNGNNNDDNNNDKDDDDKKPHK